MIQELIDSIKEAVVWAFHSILELLLDALAAVLTSIPAPDFISNASGMFSGVGSSVAFFAEAAQFGTGIAIVGAAYALRFLIRRIPIIG